VTAADANMVGQVPSALVRQRRWGVIVIKL